MGAGRMPKLDWEADFSEPDQQESEGFNHSVGCLIHAMGQQFQKGYDVPALVAVLWCSMLVLSR